MKSQHECNISALEHTRDKLKKYSKNIHLSIPSGIKSELAFFVDCAINEMKEYYEYKWLPANVCGLTNELPKEDYYNDGYDRECGFSKRVVVKLKFISSDETFVSFGKFAHVESRNKWIVEGFNGEVEVLGWSPIPEG